MLIGIILISIIAIGLLIYIFNLKRELHNISIQIKESKGEYINVNTNAIDNNLEELVIIINELYDNSQKILAKNKNIEEELKKSIANISHDLRTPLTSIMGYIQLIKDNSTTEIERKGYIEIVEKRAKRLQKLITNFYDLSRLQSNEFRFELKKVNLKTILCDNIATYYNDFINKNLEPIIEIEENIKDIISDESAVNRIFSNLIGNMLKHGSDNIKILLYKKDNYIVSTFSNLAPNLNNEDIERLFDRFYTADKSRSDKNTGLGLAITKSLVEQLGHKIEGRLENGYLIIEIKWNI